MVGGMLLKDRPFRKQGRASNNISPLDRLALIGDRGMGMLGDVPPDPMQLSPDDLSLLDMAKAMQTVLQGRDNVLLKQLSMLGGSPHGARPKVLLRLAPASGAATTRDDHAKNFTYRMARDGSFQLSPCCELGFDPGPVSGHQRAVMGEGAARAGRPAAPGHGCRPARAAGARYHRRDGDAGRPVAQLASNAPIRAATVKAITGAILANRDRLH